MSTREKKIIITLLALSLALLIIGYWYGSKDSNSENLKQEIKSLKIENQELITKIETQSNELIEKQKFIDSSKVIIKERIVTRKDGSKIEQREIKKENKNKKEIVTAKIEETKKAEEKKTVENKEEIQVVTEYKKSETLSRYSLGFSVEKKTPDILSTKPSDNLDYRVEGGIRVIGPFWGTGAYQFKSKELSVGIRLEF